MLTETASLRLVMGRVERDVGVGGVGGVLCKDDEWRALSRMSCGCAEAAEVLLAGRCCSHHLGRVLQSVVW